METGADASLSEQAVLMRSLRDTNVAKIEGDDLKIFMGLTTVVDFSPKAISTNELYGFVNMQTREWKDGIISKVMRDLGQIPDSHPKWIMLDGDLDANWIESMNSVMDDN
ncbi:Dynein alpha chain, flagellar outer arm, partial [Symbiodinium microadriaticum]